MTAAAVLVAMALAAAQAPDMAPAPAASMIEGRPSPADLSPLQARIDAAAPGSTVDVPSGTYNGDLLLDKPLRLSGHGRPLLLGSGHGSVVRVRADDVTIDGFDIDGRGGGDLGRDSSGIHITGRRARVRDCHVANTLFGIYLRESDGAVIERCVIRGLPGKAPGEKGSGIHVWDTDGFRLEGNDIEGVRDGFYIQSSPHGVIVGNSARNLRYGLHYMSSDDNRFADNLFANGDAGAALMYSRRLSFERNRFLHNRGFASVGLLLKSCDDVDAVENLIADNARGVFVEGSYRNRFHHNVIAESDTAIVLFDSAVDTVFSENSFVGNLTPLTLSGRRTDTRFDGNYWSDNEEPDLDGDGRTDRPFRLSSVFDHLRSNLTAADLMTPGLAAMSLGLAERAFPVLDPLPVVDRMPLAHPPRLDGVPRADSRPRGANAGGLSLSVVLLGASAIVLRGGGRKERRR